jgi:hypothetical protein
MAAADDSVLYLVAHANAPGGKRDSFASADPVDSLIDRVSRKFAHVKLEPGASEAPSDVDVFDARHLLPYHRDSVLAALISHSAEHHYHAVVQLRRYLSVGAYPGDVFFFFDRAKTH